MKNAWNYLFGLDEHRSLWVEREELGCERVLAHHGKSCAVKIPQTIHTRVTLRLRGLGRSRGGRTGDLLLHVWLNAGEDITREAWVSESAARVGTAAALALEERKIEVVVPPGSRDGLTLRLKGLGRSMPFNWRAPFLNRKNGHLLVKLRAYPDEIAPRYGAFEALSTDEMALEGWVYRKIDQVTQKLGKARFLVKPVAADAIANCFNQGGWRSIFHILASRFGLGRFTIELISSATLDRPGRYQKIVTLQNNTPVSSQHSITIHEQFLDNPFAVAAIMAHEMCHIVYNEMLDDTPRPAGTVLKSDQATLEEERTVDLLAFMFGVGQFQLRVARDTRLTLGYFNQELFERMQVIVARKIQ